MAKPTHDLEQRAPMTARNRARTLGGAALLALSLAVAMPVVADTLLVEAVRSAQDSAAERPRRGMTMKTVEARFGAPVTRHDAVGKPPITRWDYPDYSVFFEYQHVIHAVPKHR
jgi:hypothetical protein